MSRIRSCFPVALACALLVGCSPAPDAAPREPARESPEVRGDGEPRIGRLPDVLAAALARPPTDAGSPSEVVDQLVAAERAIADPATPHDVLAAAGHLQQVAYRALATHPGWDDPVRADLPAGLRRTVADNVAARRAFRSMHPSRQADLATELPAWRIVRPAPARVLRAAYAAAEERFGVDWSYLAAIHLVETGMGRIRGTSSAGARGPMQFIPTTWDIYGRGDINSTRDSILAAGRFLAAQGFTEPGGVAGALYRYNNSSAYVRGVTLLAELMERHPRAFHGYYHWQVYYLTRRGSVLLPEGYRAATPVPVKEYLTR